MPQPAVISISLVSLGKFGSFQADDLIGQTFGHSYEIYGKNQVRVTSNWTLEEVGMPSSKILGQVNEIVVRRLSQ